MSDMTDEKISNGQTKKQARTTGLVALAVISLLAGASVGASLEEFSGSRIRRGRLDGRRRGRRYR